MSYEESTIQELKESLLSLSKWVGMGIADGAYTHCAAPNSAKASLDKAEALLKRLEVD